MHINITKWYETFKFLLPSLPQTKLLHATFATLMTSLTVTRKIRHSENVHSGGKSFDIFLKEFFPDCELEKEGGKYDKKRLVDFLFFKKTCCFMQLVEVNMLMKKKYMQFQSVNILIQYSVTQSIGVLQSVLVPKSYVK